MSKYIFFLFFFFYIGYQFIFKLVIPLFRASSAMQQRVNQMNEARKQYESQGHQQPRSDSHNASSQPQPEKAREREGEYIDFEEIP